MTSSAMRHLKAEQAEREALEALISAVRISAIFSAIFSAICLAEEAEEADEVRDL